MPWRPDYLPVYIMLQAADIARPMLFTEIPEDDGNLVSHLTASSIIIYPSAATPTQNNAVPARLIRANSSFSFHVGGIASSSDFTGLVLAFLTLCNNSRSYLSIIVIIFMPSMVLYGTSLCHI